jgi:sensor histidine kinase YesM
MDTEAIERSFELRQAERREGGSRVGIANVHRRLRRRYGSRAGVSIRSELGEYTVVILTIPTEEETQSDGTNPDC